MERIGVRELRQHASRWLKRVARGESFEVTDRGRPIALLVPLPPVAGLEALVREGRARRGEATMGALGAPLPLEPGLPSPRETLARLRADER
ncbi:MAG: type II toxin-antitoxin system prevent-host-death family antitoxin [Deinococcales bacterium]